MMKTFNDENFLLSTETAKELYNNYAKDMPIIDYHCHINPREIAENIKFSNITEAWLYADHYKWRAIRACGHREELVTGGEGVSDYDRFAAWANTMPSLIGNPLYHWTHLELKKYFGITEPLSGKNCKAVWDKCNSVIAQEDFRVKDIIKMSGVKLVCTTDDPADDLRYHKIIAEDRDFETKVLPAFRPDKGVNIELDGFCEYIKNILSPSSGILIEDLDSLLAAYSQRIEYFAQLGCKTSDHGMGYVPFALADSDEVDSILKKALRGDTLTSEECDKYKTYMLTFFADEFSKRGWVMQIHYGVIRNNNKKAYAKLGVDSGFDTIAGYECIRNLIRLLDVFESNDILPKMVIYSLNPTENAAIVAACGCFQGNSDGIRSKIQHGSAWWFNDHLEGMREQMRTLASEGVLANFVGMLTDSRSFLSYTRHDYFRRILCDYVGGLVERGEYPCDMEICGKIISDICYNNTKEFFGFDI